MVKKMDWWCFHGGKFMFLSFIKWEKKLRKKIRIWERNLNMKEMVEEKK